MLTLKIKNKDKTHQVSIDKNKTVSDLKKQLQKLSKIPIIQQQLSQTIENKKSVYTDDMIPLHLAKITNDTQIALKNLGPQIKWNYLFYIEYAGPLIIFPLLFILGDRQNYNQIQYLALFMGILHFVKRQLQTAFVHVFSRASMPFKRVFINSLHYWVFFALFNGIELYFFPTQHSYNYCISALLVASWLVSQFCNYKCHTILSSFRKQKKKIQGKYINHSKQRGIPFGYGFNSVSCANYFWQALGWIIFSIITRTFMAYFFTILSTYQMLMWALKKHAQYKSQFGNRYPKRRKAMFPFII